MTTMEQTLHIEDDIPPFPVTIIETDDTADEVLRGLQVQDEFYARGVWQAEQAVAENKAWDEIAAFADEAIDRQIEADSNVDGPEIGRTILSGLAEQHEFAVVPPAAERLADFSMESVGVEIVPPTTERIGQLMTEAALASQTGSEHTSEEPAMAVA